VSGTAESGFQLTVANVKPATVVVDFSNKTGVPPTWNLQFKLTVTIQGQVIPFPPTAPQKPDASKAGSGHDAPTTYSFDLSVVEQAILDYLGCNPPAGFPTTPPASCTAALSVTPVITDPITKSSSNGNETSVTGGPLIISFQPQAVAAGGGVVAGNPAAKTPAAEKPAAEKPAAEKPGAETPAAKKPAAEKAAKDKATTNAPGPDGAAVDAPVAVPPSPSPPAVLAPAGGGAAAQVPVAKPKAGPPEKPAADSVRRL
jgi:hypothetical protein